jgi:DNA-binding IclR family transcriptional regulator
VVSTENRSPTDTKPKYIALVPAVEQAAKILLSLAENPSASSSLTEISKQVGIYKSKGYSILNTLMHFGFVKRDPKAKTYSLGPGCLFLSNKVLADLDLREAAAPHLRELALNTGSTAWLGIISKQHVFVIAKDEGIQEVLVTYKLGHRFPIAWGAHGKAIAAHISEDERERILAGEKLLFHGSSSRLDGNRLERELERCRQDGFAVDLGEMQTGIHAVAAPVFAVGPKLVGVIVVVGTFPKKLIEKYGKAVAAAGREFSMSIGGFSHENPQQATSGDANAFDAPRAMMTDSGSPTNLQKGRKH